MFGSALAYAIYLVGAGQTISRVGAARFTAYVMIVACVACLVQFALTRPMTELQLPVKIYALAAAMALFSTVLPAFLLAAAMHRIGSMRTSLIGSIGPVSTICLAYVFLNEPLSVVQIVGSILVLAGVLMISLRQPQSAKR